MSLQDNFRKAMRSYVYSVSILSNVSENKEYNAITVSSVTSVSIDPPSILVCINKTAGIHDSIKLGTKYCINLLTKAMKNSQISAVIMKKKKIDLFPIGGIFQTFHF